jgi:hypothetical protein
MNPFCSLQCLLRCWIGRIHDGWGLRHSTQVVHCGYCGGGTHPLFIALGHPLLVLRWCPLLGHLLEIVFWQDPCVAWACEERWPSRTFVLSDNFARNIVSTRRCFSAVMFFNVDTTSLVNSCRWSFVDRNGTWQCWGKSSADPEIRYDRVSGTK